MNTLPRKSNFPSPLIVLRVVASFPLVLVFLLLQRHHDHVVGYYNSSPLQRDTAIAGRQAGCVFVLKGRPGRQEMGRRPATGDLFHLARALVGKVSFREHAYTTSEQVPITSRTVNYPFT